MKLLQRPLLVCAFLSCLSATVQAEATRLSPSEIIANAPDSAWRVLDLDNTLLLDLATGTVIIELNPLLAPNHVNNIKKLAREGFYKNLNMYRFVEGFVAQGGDASEQKKVTSGQKAIEAEFFHQTTAPLVMTVVDDKDGYAAKTGFLNGFAVAQKSDATQTWQTHCPGTFAMARSDSPDSGGTEFYIALGTLRYLDRNITAFGRVIDGMEHLQRLDRKPKDDSERAQRAFNPILDMVVAADVKNTRPVNLEIMDTGSVSFSELVESRRNRPSSWFIETPNYTDVCAVSVPSRPFANK
ncbi:peptidylprolyl isomerase [Pseudoalteromonas tunicata]|jgi:peptidylprolyl isomerase|uniref:peptidylprolyl isomerase n=1 Tax=Pseudoalteromonas tunicata D2 TaxID=87626 RepID=A4C5K1_9GAMM|nr:peptidylprolyl isomerase [Pseudoalteromonas tunicata]ATC95229.1 peptidylprolyl isomerase [Pseudoalteromonas tunicata]AXT30835.1 peptidylprolyl isomerase [Pseudoalteromonas tunicata]EAR29255.1 putative Peptidyl-prolyl cis-trans isomerase (PPIase) [Pseudoalteromonas tunicata D2]